MKLISLTLALAAALPTGAAVAGTPGDILRRDQLILLGAAQDWQDYLAKLPPQIQKGHSAELADIKATAGAVRTMQELRARESELASWKEALIYDLFLSRAKQQAEVSDPASLAQAQFEAFRAAEKLAPSALSPEKRKFLAEFKSRVSQVSDAESLDLLFDNAGLPRPVPSFAEAFPGANGHAYVAAAPAAKGFKTREVPTPLKLTAGSFSRFAKVADFLGGCRDRVKKYVYLTIQEAVEHGVDPLLALALVKNESGFNPKATSSAGAKGLCQIMPATGKALGVRDPKQLYDPRTNASAGATYLKDMLNQFAGRSGAGLACLDPFANSGLKNAVAAYNAGPNAVKKYGGVPPYRETRGYVKKVLGDYQKLQDIYGS